MKRYKVVIKCDNGEWKNLFKDNRSFKQKSTAKGRMDAFHDMGRITNNSYDLRIEEFETVDEKDQEVRELEYYGNPESWIKRHKDSWDKSNPRDKGDEELIRSYSHPENDWVGSVTVGGKRAREAQAKIQEILES